MIIYLKKFGTTLFGRQFGKESFSAFLPSLKNVKNDEIVEIDFSGVLTLSPSWADEFLSPLLNLIGSRLVLLPSDNLSVHATLKILQEANKRLFNFKT